MSMRIVVLLCEATTPNTVNRIGDPTCSSAGPRSRRVPCGGAWETSTRQRAEAIAGQAERFDLFARLEHRDFPGGPLLRTPALVLAMLLLAVAVYLAWREEKATLS